MDASADRQIWRWLGRAIGTAFYLKHERLADLRAHASLHLGVPFANSNNHRVPGLDNAPVNDGQAPRLIVNPHPCVHALVERKQLVIGRFNGHAATMPDRR